MVYNINYVKQTIGYDYYVDIAVRITIIIINDELKKTLAGGYIDMEFEIDLINNDEQSIKIIENILNSASRLTNCGVCIYDLNRFFKSDKEVIVHDLKGHYCDFCTNIKQLIGGQIACNNSDVNEAVEQAMQYRRPFFHTCHAGLVELVIPVIHRDKIIATVFIGQCRIDEDYDYSLVWNKIKGFGANKEQLRGSFEKLPIVKRSQILDVGKLVNMSLKHLVEIKGDKAFESFFVENCENHVGEAKKFIEYHYMERISANDVAQYVHLNISYLARLFKRETGYCISDYIANIRIEKAKVLLAQTNLPINNIAVNVGYLDYSYFSKKFSKIVGISPSKFKLM